ncbi:hypothetical protein Tco_1112216 [Tanacetum coccineum]|uniref:Uncharacterized protein n=1 Tax=Tanacetum coccineum TaxID=301880 RepID=A0ABQ5IRN3_9ASTR
MINNKWKTVRPEVATFCGVHNNAFRMYYSGVGAEDYLQKAQTEYQGEEEHKSKRHKSSNDSSFNTRKSGEGGINMNSTTGDEEDEVQEVRPSCRMRETKQRGKGKRGRRRNLQQLTLM